MKAKVGRISFKLWLLGIILLFIPLFFVAAACKKPEDLTTKNPNLEQKTAKSSQIKNDQNHLNKSGPVSSSDQTSSNKFQENKKEQVDLEEFEVSKNPKQVQEIVKIETKTKEIKNEEIVDQKIDQLKHNLADQKLEIQKDNFEEQKQKQEQELRKAEQEKLALEKISFELEKSKLAKEKQDALLKKNKKILQDKQELEKEFAKIPDFLELSPTEKKFSNNNITTLLYRLKEKPSTFHYTNFIKKLENFDDDNYQIIFNFPWEVKKVDSSSNINEHKLENVQLSLLKKGMDLKLTKDVVLFWNLDQGSKLEKAEAILYKKQLSPVFSKISPSILAYALVNSGKQSYFNLPVFSDFSAAFSQVSLSVGLKTEFLGLKNAKDLEKWSFDILSANPNDQTGILKLKVQKTKTEETKQNIGQPEEFTFENLKKNGDSDFEFQIDPNLIWPQIRDKKIFRKNQNGQSLTEIQKGQIGKILLDNLVFRLKNNDSDIILKEFQVNKYIKVNNNFFAYPQIISLKWTELYKNANKMQIEIKNKKLLYSFDLEYAYLEPNAHLEPNSQSLQFSNFQRQTIKGEIPLEFILK
ncbi:LppA-related lipoprotein [Mesomycoplasma hyopneumoniae]